MKVKIRQATAQGYIYCKVGGVADISFPASDKRRGRVQGGGELSPTIMAQSNGLVRIEKGTKESHTIIVDGEYINVRWLTTREYWWLMGFSDLDFEKAAGVNNDKHLEKQAGNSIVKQVLMAIFKEMLGENE